MNLFIGISLISIVAVAQADPWALDFSGISSYVDMGNDPSLDIAGDTFTMEAWIKPDFPPGSENHRIILDKGYLPVSYRLLYHGDSRRLRACVSTPGAYYCVDAVSQHQTAEWIHIAAVYNGSQFSLYLNGRFERSIYVTGNVPSSSVNLIMGASTDLSYRWIGAIDEARISNAVRYDTEFTPRTYLSADEHTLALYHFDEGEGSIAHDCSGNNNHGTTYKTEWVAGIMPDTGVFVNPPHLEKVLIKGLFEQDTSTLFMELLDEGEAEYLVREFRPWLTVEPAHGVLAGPEIDSLQVLFDASMTGPGLHEGQIYIGFQGAVDTLLTVPVDLWIYPEGFAAIEVSTPDPVARRGESLLYEYSITNNTEYALELPVFVDIYFPTGEPYSGNPLLGPVTVLLGAEHTVEGDHSVRVPALAPLGGPYTFFLRMGDPPGDVWVEDFFEFDIIP